MIATPEKPIDGRGRNTLGFEVEKNLRILNFWQNLDSLRFAGDIKRCSEEIQECEKCKKWNHTELLRQERQHTCCILYVVNILNLLIILTFYRSPIYQQGKCSKSFTHYLKRQRCSKSIKFDVSSCAPCRSLKTSNLYYFIWIFVISFT